MRRFLHFAGKLISSLLLIELIFFSAIARNRRYMDSLENEVKLSVDDTNKVINLNSIMFKLMDTAYEQALIYGLQSAVLAQKLHYKYGLTNAYNDLGLLFYNIGNYDTAKMYFIKGLSLCDDAHTSKMITMFLNNIGTIYLDKGCYDSAVYFYTKSLDFERKTRNKRGISGSYNNLGMTYLGKADYTTALGYFLKCVAIDEEIGDSENLSQIYNNIGSLLYATGQYDKAIAYHQKALAICDSIDDKRNIAYSLNDIANAYVQKKKYAIAIACYSRALKLSETIGNKKGVIACLSNIGAVYYFQKKYSKALQYLSVSKSMSRQSGNLPGVATAAVNIGEIARDIKSYKDAIKNYNESIVIARTIGAKSLLRDAYKGLSDTYIKMRDYTNGFNFYVLYAEAKDSVLNIETRNSVNNLQIKYETEKKEKENFKLKNREMIAGIKLTKQHNQIIVWSTATFSIFVLSISTFYFWRKRKNDQFNRQLAEAKQEALNAQMSDHFIGNTMDSINGFIEDNDKEHASEYLLLFSRLIRQVLENAPKRLISLKEDIGILKNYIELEKLRFAEGALQYEIRIDKEINEENTYVPPMVFQVLVENSIKHGFKRTEGGILHLTIKLMNDRIWCVVEDNGTGKKDIGKGEENKKRIPYGTSIAEKLIRLCHGMSSKAAYNVTDLASIDQRLSGTRVEFTLPYIPAA